MAILTFVAILVAFNSNRIAKRATEDAKNANRIADATFKEMVYQREQQKRPYVSLSLDVDFEISKMFFTITNYRNRPADKISINFDDHFLKSVSDSIDNPKGNTFRVALDRLIVSEFNLAPHQSRKIHFANIGSSVIKRNADIVISYSYQWLKGNGDIDTETNEPLINLSHYHWIGETWKNKGNQPLDKIVRSLEKFQPT